LFLHILQLRKQMFLQKLQQHLEVDIWGSCGNDNMCPFNNYTQCLIRMGETYKFYLALENSICNDYVTEKFWARLKHNVIPIVLTRRTMKHVAIPSSAYIAVDDFANVEQLAKYLLYLNENTTAYVQ
jgi:hypothetical protein